LSVANNFRRRNTGGYITGHRASGRPYTRIYNPRNYINTGFGWNRQFGYGYGHWWAWRYPWFTTYIPYSLWFPYASWRPYYYVIDQDAVVRYDRGESFIDPGDIIRNPDIPLELPLLPTFQSIGVNLDALKMVNTPQLNQQEQFILQGEIAKINTRLEILKVEHANLIEQGYFPSPDFDEERFSWIQNTDSQTGVRI
jgi:hypothetical protein